MTFEESCAHVFVLGPVYHLTVYVDVPPVHDPVRVIDWPLSISGELGEIKGTDIAWLTVTVSAIEFTATGLKALSVTITKYEVVDVIGGE